MSLYLIATSSLTTPADRRRRPALSNGQVVRSLGLCAVAFLMLATAAHRGRVAMADWSVPVAQALRTH